MDGKIASNRVIDFKSTIKWEYSDSSALTCANRAQDGTCGGILHTGGIRWSHCCHTDDIRCSHCCHTGGIRCSHRVTSALVLGVTGFRFE
ncbi:hypothetical protein CDAR_591291 [Caerostris darwini]|uniref:Uncharacterized protein n=1 Tax=Caerostris darwini TaxID=1538125 RepID=A0AAV4RNR6_9ARAC|nr:hypothetical protein CDAR_591291 [Caerostris darwini]